MLYQANTALPLSALPWLVLLSSLVSFFTTYLQEVVNILPGSLRGWLVFCHRVAAVPCGWCQVFGMAQSQLPPWYHAPACLSLPPWLPLSAHWAPLRGFAQSSVLS